VQPLAPFLIAGGIAFFSIFLMSGIPKDPAETPAIGQPQSFLKTLITLKNDRTLIMFTCGCLLSTVVHGRFTLYLSQYLLVTQDTKRALETMAALLACNAISVILLQYQIGRFLKREQLRYWIAGGTSLFIPGRISVRRHPGPGRTARQLLRRAESRGPRWGAEPGDLWLSAAAHARAHHVLCSERVDGDGRFAVLHERSARGNTAKIMH
jgi:hypothetical protein